MVIARKAVLSVLGVVFASGLYNEFTFMRGLCAATLRIRYSIHASPRGCGLVVRLSFGELIMLTFMCRQAQPGLIRPGHLVPHDSAASTPHVRTPAELCHVERV